MSNNKNLIPLTEPGGFIAESYRMCRTNINYMNLDKQNQVLMITSSIAAEGKTTTICNLAITIAQAQKKVLLIEGDLRRSRIHEVLGIRLAPGLTNIIFDKIPLEKVVQNLKEVPSLDILTGGVLPLSPSELLNSQALKNILDSAREVYDVILIDTPPVLSVSDAAIISQYVDKVILVVAMNETKKVSIMNAKKALEKVGANLMGVILTKMNLSKHGDYYNDDYYNNESKKRFVKRK